MNLHHTLTPLIDQLKKDMDVDVCSLYIASTDEQHLTLLSSSGLASTALGTQLSIYQGLTGRVARTKKSVSVKNPQEDPDYFYVADSGEEAFHSYLGIPLLETNPQTTALKGVLVVQTKRTKMFFMHEIKTLYQAGRAIMDLLNQHQSMDNTPKEVAFTS